MLEKGKLMSIRPHTRFAPFPRHSHNYVEIMYMCRGKTVHRIDGDALVTLEAGELLFLNRHASHAIQRADAGDIAVNFIVLPQFFDEAFNMAGMDNVLSRFLLGELYTGGAAVSYLHFRVREVLPVQNLVENMVWTLVNRQPGARRINQVTMGLLLLQLMHYTECIDMSRNGSIRSPMVEAALREIEENYRAASLTDVAAAFHVGLPYLSAEVKQCHGKHLQGASAAQAAGQSGASAAGDAAHHTGGLQLRSGMTTPAISTVCSGGGMAKAPRNTGQNCGKQKMQHEYAK